MLFQQNQLTLTFSIIIFGKARALTYLSLANTVKRIYSCIRAVKTVCLCEKFPYLCDVPIGYILKGAGAVQ